MIIGSGGTEGVYTRLAPILWASAVYWLTLVHIVKRRYDIDLIHPLAPASGG